MSEEDVQDVVEKAVDTGKSLNPSGLASLAGDMGWGFFTLSVAIYAGAVSANKFHDVWKGRGRAVTP